MKLRPNNTLVRVKRRGRLDHLDGYILDVGTRYALVALLANELVLDGFSVVRTDGIVDVKRRPTAAFVERVLRARNQWPPSCPVPIDLDSVVGALSSLTDAPIIEVRTDITHPHVFYVGEIVKVGKRNLHLHDVHPDGRWAPEITTFPLRDITRVDVGTLYAYAFVQAGEPSRRA